MGLGSADTAPLAEARHKVEDARRTLIEGPCTQGPLAAVRVQEEAMTFGPFADALATDLSKGFRNAVHRAQWEMTLGPTYCSSIRDKRLDEVTTNDILAILKPIWTQKAETASRLRDRLERVLDAARVKGLRTGETPARWKGHLDTLLHRRQKLQRSHHAALPYGEMPAFMARLYRTPLLQKHLNSYSYALRLPLQIPRRPAVIDSGLGRPIKPEDGEEATLRCGRQPVGFLSFGRLGANIKIG